MRFGANTIMEDLYMKYYTLSYVSNNRTIFVSKRFKTRSEAINYAFKKLPLRVELSHEIDRGNHFIEYVCSNFNRFFVSRCYR
jgi:hypothetical protein